MIDRWLIVLMMVAVFLVTAAIAYCVTKLILKGRKKDDVSEESGD